MKHKFKIKDIWYYTQGNIRYKLYYSRFRFLIPKYIIEQIESRIDSMDNECYMKGFCKMCGCQTTHLQMCNKPCDKPCYPKMLSKIKWDRLKKGYISYCDKTDRNWLLKENKFIKI